MAEFDILNFLGLDRAKSIYSENEKLLDGEFVLLSEVKEKGFGIDSVYFNILKFLFIVKILFGYNQRSFGAIINTNFYIRINIQK